MAPFSQAINRRFAIQKMTIAAAGLSLISLPGCQRKEHDDNLKNTSNPLSPFYLPPAASLLPGPGGIDIRVLVRSAQTNGQFSSVETAVAPKQMGPAPHIHKELDEMMYVMEGTASVMVGGRVEEIAAGGWHFRPRGIEHTFWNASDKSLRFIDMYFNQNFEDYLEELFHQIIPDMERQKLSVADPGIRSRLASLDKKFAVTMFPEKRQSFIDRYGLKA